MTPCRWVDLSGTTILLDARRGSYLALGPEDSRTWHRLLTSAETGCHDEAVDRLRTQAAQLGLLDAPSFPPPSRQAPRKPTLAWAAWCIVRAGLMLRVRGFLPAYRWASASRLVAPTATATLRPALTTFFRAEHAFVSPLGLADCLPRSLALFAFLAASGLSVTHVIGVRRFPFAAHAWVEHDGAKLLQVPNPEEPFTPIAVLVA